MRKRRPNDVKFGPLANIRDAPLNGPPLYVYVCLYIIYVCMYVCIYTHIHTHTHIYLVRKRRSDDVEEWERFVFMDIWIYS